MTRPAHALSPIGSDGAEKGTVAMLDLKFILANLEQVRQAVKEKHCAGSEADLERMAALDEKRCSAQTENDKLAAEKNRISKQVGPPMGQLKKAAGDVKASLG